MIVRVSSLAYLLLVVRLHLVDFLLCPRLVVRIVVTTVVQEVLLAHINHVCADTISLPSILISRVVVVIKYTYPFRKSMEWETNTRVLSLVSRVSVGLSTSILTYPTWPNNLRATHTPPDPNGLSGHREEVATA